MSRYLKLLLSLIMLASCGGEIAYLKSAANKDSLPPVIGVVLQSLTDISVNEGNGITGYVLFATGNPELSISYSCINNCITGLEVNSVTGEVAFTPDYSQAGTYENVTFTATDGKTSDTKAITITVNNVINFQGWVGGVSGGGITDGWTLGDTSTSGSGDSFFTSPDGLAVDTLGNLYISDTDNNRIKKFSSDGTFIGWIGRISGGDVTSGWHLGDSATSSSGIGAFYSPRGLFIDKNNKLYVADRGNARIQIFFPDGTLDHVMPMANACFEDVAVDINGNIYVSEYFQVNKFDSTGNFSGWIGALDTGGDTDGWEKDVGLSTHGSGDGQFLQPWGIDTDSEGNFYVADSGNNRIQKFNSNGVFQGWLGWISGVGFTNGWHSGGTASCNLNPGGLCSPGSLYIDKGNGNKIYVAHSYSYINIYNSDGTFDFKLGSSGTGPGEFSNVYGIATDSTGNIYVADSYRVKKFDSVSNFVGWIGRRASDGLPNIGWSNPETIAEAGSGDAEFNEARGIKIDEVNDKLFVVDGVNQRIQIFKLSDGVFQDKIETSDSSLKFIDIDSSGNIYATGYNRVHLFDSLYEYQLSYGSSGGGDGQFSRTAGIKIVGTEILVVDNNWTTGGQRVQKWSDLTFSTYVGWVGHKDATTITTGWHIGDNSIEGSSSLQGALHAPRGIAVDNERDLLYVADWRRNYINVYVLSSGAYVTRFYSSSPQYIDIDGQGNIYITNSSGVSVFSVGTYSLLNTIGTSGTGDGEFSSASGIGFFGFDMFVVDKSNHRIQKW